MDRTHIALMEQGLVDLSYSDIAVLQRVCLSQVEQNKENIGWAKIFTSIFFLLEGEKKRREAVLQEQSVAFND